jgi:hypothetical protein
MASEMGSGDKEEGQNVGMERGTGNRGRRDGGHCHLPVPEMPRPPHSNPIAIPRSLSGRRHSYVVPMGQQSGLPDSPEVPRPSTPISMNYPVFIFHHLGSSRGRRRGKQLIKLYATTHHSYHQGGWIGGFLGSWWKIHHWH